MKIEIATIEDVPEILELQHKAFYPVAEQLNWLDAPNLTETVNQAREDFPKFTVLIMVDDNGKIIGSVRGNVDDGSLYIGRLMVLPEFQQNGYGRLLFHKIQELLPHRRVWLETCAEVQSSFTFYEREGFKTFKTKVLENGLSWVSMEKTIMKTEPIFQTLADLNIPYEIQEHKAIFSEEDAKDVVITLEGIDVKNLFVKDKNGNYGLVSMNLHRRADLKKIAALFGFGRLSFCNADELMQYLNITPGSVSPLCVMFDTTKTVKVLYDSHFEGRNVIIHPLRNTASISIKFDDLKRFTEHFGHNWQLGDFYVAPNVEFVPLKADDAPAISEMSAMATEILRDYYDPIIGKEQNDYMLAKFQTVSAITDNLHHGYRFYFVRSDGHNAGFMAFYPREGAMYLSKFYLYKHERGKGLARQMLTFLADETRRASLSAIELNVNKHNPTLQIYKSLGFTTIRAEKIDIGGGFYMDDYVERLEV